MVMTELQRQRKEAFTPDVVKGMLLKHGVDISSWGQDSTKNIEELVTELNSGESSLDETSDGLLRRVRVLALDVFVRVGDTVFILVEDRQEFQDGSVRRRNLSTSLGEKLKFDGSPEQTARRALSEELGIGEFYVRDLRLGHIEESPRESGGYPGLPTNIAKHYAAVMIDPAVYRAEGYKEQQERKTTYFKWLEFKD